MVPSWIIMLTALTPSLASPGAEDSFPEMNIRAQFEKLGVIYCEHLEKGVRKSDDRLLAIYEEAEAKRIQEALRQKKKKDIYRTEGCTYQFEKVLSQTEINGQIELKFSSRLQFRSVDKAKKNSFVTVMLVNHRVTYRRGSGKIIKHEINEIGNEIRVFP